MLTTTVVMAPELFLFPYWCISLLWFHIHVDSLCLNCNVESEVARCFHFYFPLGISGSSAPRLIVVSSYQESGVTRNAVTSWLWATGHTFIFLFVSL